MTDQDILLYGFFRSSCSGRLRIALHWKGIAHTPIYVNLAAGQQLEGAHRELNPSCTVPVLVFRARNNLTIGQSLAAMEYLEETFPGTSPLLPPPDDSAGRAYVRALVYILASDTQPLTSRRIFKRVQALGKDHIEWARESYDTGLAAFEDALSRGPCGLYCYGDSVTLADVVLAPSMWKAIDWSVDLTGLPNIRRVYANLEKLPAFTETHWSRQPDCPDELKQTMSQ